MWGEIKARHPLQKSAALCFRPHLINQEHLLVDLCLISYRCQKSNSPARVQLTVPDPANTPPHVLMPDLKSERLTRG